MSDYQLSGVVTLKDQTKQATASAAQNVSSMENAFNKAKAALTAFGVVATAKAIIQLGEMGAQAKRTESGFETISGGSQAAAKNLEAMMRATDGAIDRTTAMGVANQMMQMGLASSAEELGKNAQLATRLGRAMGVDATTAMENWNAMMANQSIPRLDTFGISSGKVRVRIEELMKQTQGLTREQAFNQAVMEQAEIAMARLGDTTEDAALKVEQSKAAWKDMKAEIGMGFMGAVSNSERGLGKLMIGYTNHLRMTRDMRDDYSLLRLNVATFFDFFGAKSTIFDEYAEQQERTNRQIERGAALTEAYNKQIAEDAIYAGNAAIAHDQYQMALEQSRLAGESAIPTYYKMAGIFGEMDTKMELLTTAFQGPLKQETESYNSSLASLAEKAAGYSATITELSGKSYLTDAQREQLAAAQQGLVDTQTETEALAAKHEEATARIIFGFAQQEAAADGVITQDEYDMLAELGKRYGLLDEDSATALMNIKRNFQLVRDGIIDAKTGADLLGGSIDALTRTVTIDFKYNVTEPPGGWPSGPGGEPQRPEGFAAGGTSLGGWHWVGERGPELAYLSPGSRVIDRQGSQQISNNQTINLYGAANAGWVVDQARQAFVR